MTSYKAIGGYFGLELKTGKGYHEDLIALNTGRNALEYILRARNYNHVYIPYYCCDVILEPLIKLNIAYEFYSINENLEIVNPEKLKLSSGILYINYFGLKATYIKQIYKSLPNLIVDASQAFFYKPIDNVDTFYSARKFFGVPDGSYVSCNKKLTEDFPIDISVDRFSHLIKRIDCGAEDGYVDFKSNEAALCGQPIKSMSNLTSAVLNGLNYEVISGKRKKSFNYLHHSLKAKNEFKWISDMLSETPMVYPFYTKDNNLRRMLIENKVYIATYWSNVKNWAAMDAFEYNLCTNLLPLPG